MIEFNKLYSNMVALKVIKAEDLDDSALVVLEQLNQLVERCMAVSYRISFETLPGRPGANSQII